VGGLDEKVTEALMWELFVQSGPVGEYTIFSCYSQNMSCIVWHPTYVGGYNTYKFFFYKHNY
jgi:hypothetical protein